MVKGSYIPENSGVTRGARGRSPSLSPFAESSASEAATKALPSSFFDFAGRRAFAILAAKVSDCQGNPVGFLPYHPTRGNCVKDVPDWFQGKPRFHEGQVELPAIPAGDLHSLVKRFGGLRPFLFQKNGPCFKISIWRIIARRTL